jgi:class 3 adenylate cyclase
MSPGENFNFINSYLSRISPVIRENHGFIDKYIGDGIMALFPGDPRNALNAAMALLQTLDEYNLDRLNSGYREIRVGIGINYGRLMLGTIGEEHRLEGTVISDTVNMASRLEQLTKVFQTDVIISEYLGFPLPGRRLLRAEKAGPDPRQRKKRSGEYFRAHGAR